MTTLIRKEHESDYAEITKIKDLAFGKTIASILVEKTGDHLDFFPELSLIAEVNGQVVGHILFIPVQIINGDKVSHALSLRSMAILPGMQNKKLGSELIIHGLDFSRKIGFGSVIMVGQEHHCPRLVLFQSQA